MEIIFKFKDDEKDNALIALHGMDFALSLWDIDQKLRAWMKYGYTNEFNNIDECLDAISELLYETLDDYGISLDMIK